MGTGILGRTLLLFSAVMQWILTLLSPDSRLHQARFARTHELRPLLPATPPTAGLLLGSRKAGTVAIGKTATRRELGNSLVVGPTRSGKGLLAVSQLLAWQQSVIVNDIKGELFTQTAGYRATLGPVFVIDPTGVGHRFDPLVGKQTEDELYSSASHLLFKPDEGEGAIFTERATVMLTQILLAARKEGRAAFPYIRSLIRGGLAAATARLNQLDPCLATQFLDVSFADANLSDRFLLSSWGTLTARLRPLLTETLVRCFTKSDFTAEELLCSEQPVTVYLRWPERDLLALSPLVRLLWGALIDELITNFDRRAGSECNPVLLLIDEAGRTAIPSLADHATTVVGRGVSLWMAVQSLSQLDTVYGRARAQVLRDNMESQLYYRPTDLATAKYLEARLGDTSAYAHSTTSREGGVPSEGLAERPIPLLTAQEILQLPDTQVIGFHRHLPPFRLTRMDWRTQPILEKRRTMPAPQLPQLPALSDMPVRNREDLKYELIDPDLIHKDTEQAAGQPN